VHVFLTEASVETSKSVCLTCLSSFPSSFSSFFFAMQASNQSNQSQYLCAHEPHWQVNPHIIPFFYHNRGRDGRPSTWRLWAGGWRGGFVLSALELWLKEDMLKTLRVLAGRLFLDWELGYRERRF